VGKRRSRVIGVNTCECNCPVRRIDHTHVTTHLSYYRRVYVWTSFSC